MEGLLIVILTLMTTGFVPILIHSLCILKDKVVRSLINNTHWSAVSKCIRTFGDQESTWNIGGVLVKTNILLSVAEHDWTCIKETNNDATFRWIIQQACTRATKSEIVESVLPHCAGNRLHSVLTTLVYQRLWKLVGELLQRDVRKTQHRWAVEKACNEAKNDHFKQYIPPDCSDEYMDTVLSNLLRKHVGKRMLQRIQDSKLSEIEIVTETQHLLTMIEASKQAESDDFVQNILPYCFDQYVDFVLPNLVKQHLWKLVVDFLQRGVSETLHRWTVEEASKEAESDDFVQYILPYCFDQYFDSILPDLVKRHLWKLVDELLQRVVSETLHRRTVEEAIKEAASEDFIKYILPHCSLYHVEPMMPNLVKQGDLTTLHTVMCIHGRDMESFVLPHWYVDVLLMFLELGLWNYVPEILHSVVINSLYHLVIHGGEIKNDDSVFWALVNTCRVNATDTMQFFKMAKKDTTSHVRKVHNRLGLTTDLCELLYTSLLDQLCVALCSDGKQTEMVGGPLQSYINLVCNKFFLHLETISTNPAEGIIDRLNKPEFKTPGTLLVLNEPSSSLFQIFLHVLQQFNQYYVRRRDDADDKSFLILLSVLPFVPELQSVALRIMLRHKRWNVISQADLSGVWEQDRRHLLQAAVKQRQWSVVKRWADHSLYDDQRVWALNEALNEKQWDVALLLADHGLTDIDLMRVHYRLAKYADWDVILHMFERGADVAEVGERLGRIKDNKRIPKNIIRCIDDRCSKVRNLEKKIQMAKSDALENACRSCNWICVLFTLIRNPGKVSVHCALKVAIKKKAWHVVMQLVRLGMDAKQRHSLFSWMMKRQQWGVCRVLQEQGLSVQLCLKVLPKLMDMNQWALVARVMEHDVGDDVRHQVMQRAWERREGSVVWLCIKSLPTPLSVEEREALFQRAFSCELWQVIKPLVEEKDETGIRHRDTALLAAIYQHQWDLVDHCQRHHADINMKDDDGHTPLQRAAMKKDWEAVEELVVRDGDPNLLDREGYTLLHRAIDAQQTGIVYLLIQFHADIHKGEESWRRLQGVTPLSMLIDTCQGDMIEHTLLWCPDQCKGVNDIGETTLHAACLSGCHNSMYYLVARRVNPLAMTETGQSALVYAVLNEDCPQRMVAECIRLGFSTHQPKLTNIRIDKKCLNPYYRHGRIIWHRTDRITSPFLCALLRGLPVVMQMLYESGACSQRELFRLYTELPGLADPNTDEGRKLQERAGHAVVAYQNFVYCIEDIALPYLTEIATTPRSLVSTCRLVISHCLTLSKTRHRDVDQLPLPERMKNFVLFSDLTDPDFGKDTT